MRAPLLGALLLAACGGPSVPPPRAPVARPRSEPPPVVAVVVVAEPEPPPPCVASPPSAASLAALAQPGLIRVDASAPRELGACVSPALVSREGELACDPTGTRCRVGERHVLLAREADGACVPLALVVYPASAPDTDPAEILDALAIRDEACALHDRVARSDASLYAEVARARRIAPGPRAELAAECLADADALALAAEARDRFAHAPLVCSGLRCESAAGPSTPDTAAPAASLLFANRLSGPLRFDAVAWLASSAEQPRALQLLRRRCR